ncbi:MAG: hypothetical protein ACTHLY_21905 [Pseudolabrys sp.]
MTRSELYTLVWQTPSVRVAAQLGLSNAAFRKLCHDYRIPLPRAGYWTKVAHGKPVERTPLPEVAPKIVDDINQALKSIGRTALDVTDAQIADYSLQLVPPEPVADAALKLPVVSDVVRALRGVKPDKNRYVELDWPAFLHLRVGRDSMGRSVTFLAALFQTAVAAGFNVSRSGIAHGEEVFGIRLYETTHRSGDPSSDQPFEVTPSGRLCFEIYDPRPFVWIKDNIIGRWHDGKDRRIERQIAVALADTKNAAPLIQEARALVEMVAPQHASDASPVPADLVRKRAEFFSALAKKHAELESLKNMLGRLTSGDRDSPGHSEAVLALEQRIAGLDRELSIARLKQAIQDSKLFSVD